MRLEIVLKTSHVSGPEQAGRRRVKAQEAQGDASGGAVAL